MTAEIKPIPVSIEHLDFSPECETGKISGINPCHNKATWHASMAYKCCHRVPRFFCDSHARKPTDILQQFGEVICGNKACRCSHTTIDTYRSGLVRL